MKFNLNTVIVIVLAAIGLGVIAVAMAGVLQWFFDHFWIIFLSGLVILGLILWLRKNDKDDGAGRSF